MYIQVEDGSNQLRKADIKNVKPVVNPIVTKLEVEWRIPNLQSTSPVPEQRHLWRAFNLDPRCSECDTDGAPA